jgi:hypothetical protein
MLTGLPPRPLALMAWSLIKHTRTRVPCLLFSPNRIYKVRDFQALHFARPSDDSQNENGD